MPTLTSYRQAAAQELGRYISGTATSGSTTAQLECTASPFKSTLSQDTLYQDYWLFRPNAMTSSDKLRVVDTYTPSTGMFTPDNTYTNAAYANGTGEAFELHGIVEPLTDMATYINDTLKRCMTVVEVSFVPVALQTRQSLAAFSTWLTDPRWVRRAGFLVSGEDRNQVDPYVMRPVRGQTTIDGTTLYLNHAPYAFAGTETIYLTCYKQAYYQCAAAAQSYGSQSGLSLETDICPVATDWVAAGTLVEAWRRIGHLLEPASNQRLVRDRGEAAAWFQQLTLENFQTVPLATQLVRTWGPWQA